MNTQQLPASGFSMKNSRLFEIALDDGLVLDSKTFEFGTDQIWRWKNIEIRLEEFWYTGGFTTKLVLTNKGDIKVDRVRFPVVPVHMTHHDLLLMASPWGDCLHEVAKTIREYCAAAGTSWVYDYVKVNQSDEISYSYPSIMAMQLMTVYNESESMSVSCRSMRDDTMHFVAHAIGKYDIELCIDHFPFHGQGEWMSPECCISTFKEGGWHAAADHYARTVAPFFSAPKLPVWMKDHDNGFHGWYGLGMHFEGKPVQCKMLELWSEYEKATALGLKCIHIYGWSGKGHDTVYPDYIIDPAVGTAQEFKTVMDRIKNDGGCCIAYTNGRLVDPASEFFMKYGEDVMCQDSDNKVYIEKYNTSADFRMHCPSLPEYRVYFANQIAHIIKDYGTHAIQVDQISCNHSYFCYSPNHPHSTPANNFLGGVEADLRLLRETHKQLDERFFTWMEGCHERFGQFYDVHQGHGEEYTWQLGESIPEQFKYVYPEAIVTGMCADIQQLCHTHAQGKPYDLQYAALDQADFAELFKKLLAFRKNNGSYYMDGTYIDNRGIDAYGARAYGITAPDKKSMLVTLWKKGAELDTTSVAWVKKAPHGFAVCKPLFPESVLIEDGGWLRAEWQGPLCSMELS